MRKSILAILSFCVTVLTSCLDTTQEITLNEDGSGTVTYTNDMSTLISLAKQMGGAADLEKAGDQNMDSTIALKDGMSDLPSLSAEEKELAKNGMLKIMMNIKQEKFQTTLTFPFTQPGQIEKYNKLSGKVMAEAMKDKLSEGGQAIPSDQMPAPSSFDDYYKLEFSDGELTRKVDKDKYTGVESDEYFKGVRQASSMGLTMKAKYVINLPRPATKAEGKNVKLSDDKKKVTVTADIEDFFADPSALEFKIKY